jgi:hypothetical protein
MTSYSQSSHNEFRDNTIHGDVLIGRGTNHPTGDRELLRRHKEIFQTLGQETEKSEFLGMLSQSDQHQDISKIPPINTADPNFLWILRNIDFKCWRSHDIGGLPVLWLLGPSDHGMTEVLSYIVGQEKRQARNIFYFFCAFAERGSPVIDIIFIESILYHILSYSGKDQAKVIADAFISTLLYTILRLNPYFKV